MEAEVTNMTQGQYFSRSELLELFFIFLLPPEVVKGAYSHRSVFLKE